jgi:hypothetical protein
MLASKLDLDGDGSSEYLVEFDTGGSLHVTGFMILDGQLDQRSYEVIGFEDTDPLDEMSHLVRRDGRIYLMWQAMTPPPIPASATGRLRPRLPPTRRGGFRPAFPTCHPAITHLPK